MTALTGYHKQMKELADELVNHGYGEMAMKVTSLKDHRVRVQINCGRMFVHIIEKDLNKIPENII